MFGSSSDGFKVERSFFKSVCLAGDFDDSLVGEGGFLVGDKFLAGEVSVDVVG